MKNTICLDFDGVCNTYDGWKGELELFGPRDGLWDFIQSLIARGRRVAVSSTRPPERLQDWFERHFPDLREHIVSGDLYFPDKKPPADCYIDDRAVRFDGSFADILPFVLSFQTFWERQKNEAHLGATGRFPGGKLNSDDEGELKMGLSHDPRQQVVVLNFGKPVEWIGLPPVLARELANGLLQHAAQCEANKQ